MTDVPGGHLSPGVFPLKRGPACVRGISDAPQAEAVSPERQCPGCYASFIRGVPTIHGPGA